MTLPLDRQSTALESNPQSPKGVYFKRSEFRHVKPSAWVTFNVRAEDADDAEKLLSGEFRAAAPQAGAGLTDEQIIVALENAGVKFQWNQPPFKTAPVQSTLGSVGAGKLVAAVRALLAAHPTGKAEDAQDAVRYRFLRSRPLSVEPDRIDVVYWSALDESANEGEGLRGEALDKAIDAAMTAAQPESGAGHAD
jgi:hypothetical protein